VTELIWSTPSHGSSPRISCNINAGLAFTFNDTGLTRFRLPILIAYAPNRRRRQLSAYSSTASASTPARRTHPPTAVAHKLAATAAFQHQQITVWTASKDNVG